jgi:hypothetical protein
MRPFAEITLFSFQQPARPFRKEGKVMPPKSTRFEQKLRSGLFVYLLE